MNYAFALFDRIIINSNQKMNLCLIKMSASRKRSFDLQTDVLLKGGNMRYNNDFSI